MSCRRLFTACAAMAALAYLLSVSTPDLAATVDALARPQRTVDAAGADALLLAAAGAAAWAVWAWGALGLALTVASVVPGAGGALAEALLTVLLPGAARRAAAVALGVGLAAPVLLVSPGPVDAPVVLAAAVTTRDVPDWPRAEPAPVPDWPVEQPTEQPTEQPVPEPSDQPVDLPRGAHVVEQGDCLWDIAADRLAATGSVPSAARTADAVQAWWQLNAGVIGSDPDLILPGQVLEPPPQP